MRFVLFSHSLISDWNHGNAHFLRGIVTELMARGHDVAAFEPHDGWSRQQLLAEAGPATIARFHLAFPQIRSMPVDLDRLDLDEALDEADAVIVHEWNSRALVARVGQHKARGGKYALLFHDTHHRSLTNFDEMERYDLSQYDGVLAFGEVIRQRYLALGWGRRVWTWHEAADVRVFGPRDDIAPIADLVWIGNWGDGERTDEIRQFMIDPVRTLALRATVFGVRYPDDARAELDAAGIRYCGWLANYDAPAAYAHHRMTVHIPRRPYVQALPGIPTIRVFEALACGIPLVSAPWNDIEGLFAPGEDFLVADSPAAMRSHLQSLAGDADLRRALAVRGLDTIRRRHTCAHRVDELLDILARIRVSSTQEVVSA